MEKELVKVEKVIAKGKKYQVFIDINDEEYKFSENQIVTNRIIKGAIFTIEDWNEIVNSQNTSLLFDQMLHFIDYKLRTKKEVIEKLISKKAEQKDIDIVIERLEKINYIDDERYVSLFVQDAIRDLKGPSYIKFTLEQKGIENILIIRELEKVDDLVFEENANVLATRYQKTINNHPANKQKELIMQKLARNGFSYDVMNKVIRNLSFKEDDLDKLKEEYVKIFARTNDVHKTITSLMQKGYRYEDIKKVNKQE